MPARSKAPDRRLATALIMLAFALSLSGCWSRRELDRTGFVLGFGLDKIENQKVDLSVQVAVPGMIGGGKEGGGSGGGDKPPVWVARVSGPTVFEAVRSLNTRSNDPLYWAHARVFVISEEAAKRGIRPVLDFLFRQPQIRPEVLVVVTPDDPGEIMQINSPQEKVPAFYLANILEQAHLDARTVRTVMKDVRISVFEPGREWVAPVVHAFSEPQPTKPETKKPPKSAEAGKGKGQGGGGGSSGGGEGGGGAEKPKELQVSGVAVFRGERMVGTLSPQEAAGLSWIMGQIRSTPVTVDFPDAPQHVSVEILRAGTKIRVTPDTVNPGKSRYKVSITGECNIQELATFGGTQHPRPPDEINHALSGQVARTVRRTVQSVQKKYQADVFGFGELYREAVPAEVWSRVGPKWASYFPNVRVDIEVNLAVRRRGLTLQP